MLEVTENFRKAFADFPYKIQYAEKYGAENIVPLLIEKTKSGDNIYKEALEKGITWEEVLGYDGTWDFEYKKERVYK